MKHVGSSPQVLGLPRRFWVFRYFRLGFLDPPGRSPSSLEGVEDLRSDRAQACGRERPWPGESKFLLQKGVLK